MKEARDDEYPPLTEAQRAEIERRLHEIERDPSRAVSWNDVRARLLSHGRRDPRRWQERSKSS
jgi:putative addiction module component (TIGR02574 family)